MAFHAAFYKAPGTLLDKIIRFWEGGPYSHCELLFSDGWCASATNRDGWKVRGKYIVFDEGAWDFVRLPDEMERHAREFFDATAGAKYDLLGQIRFVCLQPFKGFKGKYWCSNWCAEALNLLDPWRYGPNGLRSAIELVRK